MRWGWDPVTIGEFPCDTLLRYAVAAAKHYKALARRAKRTR